MRTSSTEDKQVAPITKTGPRALFTNRQAEAVAQAIRMCEANPDMTIRELYWDVWTPHHAMVNLSENSQASYRSVIGKHVLPLLGDVVARTLTKAQVETYIGQCAAQAGCYRAITPWVLKLQALLTKAVQYGLIDKNPVMQIDALFVGGKPEGLEKAS